MKAALAEDSVSRGTKSNKTGEFLVKQKGRKQVKQMKQITR